MEICRESSLQSPHSAHFWRGWHFSETGQWRGWGHPPCSEHRGGDSFREHGLRLCQGTLAKKCLSCAAWGPHVWGSCRVLRILLMTARLTPAYHAVCPSLTHSSLFFSIEFNVGLWPPLLCAQDSLASQPCGPEVTWCPSHTSPPATVSQQYWRASAS
jgi:hypothetical protein